MYGVRYHMNPDSILRILLQIVIIGCEYVNIYVIRYINGLGLDLVFTDLDPDLFVEVPYPKLMINISD